MKLIQKFLAKIFLAYSVVVLLAVQVNNPSPGFFVQLRNGNTFENLGAYIIQGILGIVGILALIFLIIGGVRYITAAGDSEAAESGKKTVTNAIIGLVIVILSYVIVAVVVNALYGNVEDRSRTPVPIDPRDGVITPGTPIELTPPTETNPPPRLPTCPEGPEFC